MSYAPPPASALNLAFVRGHYTPPASATNLDFAALASVAYSRVPGVIADVGTPWRPSPGAKQSTLASLFAAARYLEIERRGNANQAGIQSIEDIRGLWGEASERNHQTAAAWDAVPPRERKNVIPSQMAAEKDIEGRAAVWEETSQHLDPKTASSFLVKTPWKDRHLKERYYSSAIYAATWRRQENLPAQLAVYTEGKADFGTLTVNWGKVQDLHALGGLFENNPIQPKDGMLIAPHRDAPSKDDATRIPWGPSGSRDTTLQFEYPDYNGPITEPGDVIPAQEQETYCFMNSVNVTRVSDGTPIDMQNITLSLDVDSWAWQMTGQVIGSASLAMIEPSEAGLVDIQVELNSHLWIFMIERYSGNRKHANEKYTVKAVSRTQLLAAPYAPQRSKTYTTEILADQIIDDELLNTGFTVEWDATVPRWTVAADAFSYQTQTPLAVAKAIADAAGAILVPSKTGQSLTIKPRLKISPWALESEPLNSLDVQIPMAMVSTVAMQFQPAPLFDSVYISGTAVGVASMVTRTGQAGSAPAPDIFDDLMTDTDVTTERARQVIGASGNRGMYTLTLPVPEFEEAPGLVEPGMMAEVIEGPQSWRGYVLGVSITAPRSGAEKIEQQIKLVRLYEHNS